MMSRRCLVHRRVHFTIKALHNLTVTIYKERIMAVLFIWYMKVQQHLSWADADVRKYTRLQRYSQ